MNDVLDEAEAAALLDCEASTIQEKARSGELPGIKIGRSWRFPRTALLEALHVKALANMNRKTDASRKPKAVMHAVPARKPPTLPSL